MISTLAGPATPVSLRAAAGRDPSDPAARSGKTVSSDETRAADRSRRKALAQQRLNAVMERMNALKLMIKLDARAALKMTAVLAKELQAAVKAYREAGGRNVSTGDLALIRQQAQEARKAQEASAEAASAAGADLEVKQANEAYGATAARDIERLTDAEATAMADYGFFERARMIVGGLKDARDKIRAEAPFQKNRPDEDDWKESDEALKTLERDIDGASAGSAVRSGGSVMA